jgi:hypothetical protein
MKGPAPSYSDSATPRFPTKFTQRLIFTPGVSIVERVLNEIGHRRVGELFGKLSPGVGLIYPFDFGRIVITKDVHFCS